MINMSKINWNHIYSFYEVAKSLSIRHTARRLGISPSTLSEQIKKLEDSLQVSLLKKEGRGIALTSDGLIIAEYCKDMFQGGNKIVEHLLPDDIGGQTVRIGLPETNLLLVTDFLATYWDRFASYGMVHTFREALCQRAIERVAVGDLDWAVVLTPSIDSGLSYTKLGDFEVAFCVLNQIYTRFKDPAHILLALPLVRSRWDRVLNSQIDNRLKEAGIRPREVMISDHRDLCLKLTQRGRTIGTFATKSLENNAQLLDLAPFHIGSPITIPIYAVWQKSKSNTLMIKKIIESINAKQLDCGDDFELQLRVADVPKEWFVGQSTAFFNHHRA